MKTKRVGTLSMAFVLIFFGVILLISQVSKVSGVELFIKFWPVILIIIGLEVLYYVYINGDDIKIKYDVFSIFIVIFILLINIGIYGLMEIGVIDLIKLEVQREIDNYQDR
ncbi:LiaI-LiaF-like domain-containing protein [Tissierella creatinophila]|uniref:LiaI-LiaF-like transmembrane region domain-containing protein n=1 Tax=Tissierella creatinophila DSM 6911 TaxID=1123403 RepID=A0A1U7M8E3_TISCR|nr:DUF5668 domain-containing protein [Tissierella creatinophila]OLS03468.1 hypothetical protein TICRE_04620 [Tissierella creatinophila DSM 6911]